METIAVKTLEMTMEVAYEIAMTWIDNRLKYHNLKANDSLNKLDMDAVRRLWIPQVNFINTDNIHRTHIDEDVVMFIRRRTHKFYMDPAAPAEGKASQWSSPKHTGPRLSRTLLKNTLGYYSNMLVHILHTLFTEVQYYIFVPDNLEFPLEQLLKLRSISHDLKHKYLKAYLKA